MAASTSMEIMEGDANIERDREIEKIMKITDIIIEESQISEQIKIEFSKDIIDLDISNELSTMLLAVYTCLREEENDPNGHQKYKSYTAKVGVTEISIQKIIEKVNAANIKLNFFVATSIVEIMTVFEGFFHEVTTGFRRFKLNVSRQHLFREPTKKQITQNISQYGLSNDHIPLLQGLTLAPERRTGIPGSLGPLAQAILMVTEDKCCTKLNSALNSSLQMLPMANDIINCLKNVSKLTEASFILKQLGDILLLTTSRHTQNSCFPLLFCIYLWRLKGSTEWSFSGTPMLKLYNAAAKKVQFNIKTGASSLMTSEIIFHSMFGTYVKDLSILQQITNHNKWHQRKEMNAVFKNRAEKPVQVVKPILFKYVPTMIQAYSSQSLGNMNEISSRPSFSGYRRRSGLQKYLANLRVSKSGIFFSSDPMQVGCALRKLKNLWTEDKDIIDGGTMKWEEFKEEAWVESDFVPLEENLKFFGYQFLI